MDTLCQQIVQCIWQDKKAAPTIVASEPLPSMKTSFLVHHKATGDHSRAITFCGHAHACQKPPEHVVKQLLLCIRSGHGMSSAPATAEIHVTIVRPPASSTGKSSGTDRLITNEPAAFTGQYKITAPSRKGGILYVSEITSDKVLSQTRSLIKNSDIFFVLDEASEDAKIMSRLGELDNATVIGISHRPAAGTMHAHGVAGGPVPNGGGGCLVQ